MGHLHGSVALAKNNGTLLGGDGREEGRGKGESLFADWILNVTADEAPEARTRIFTRALSCPIEIFLIIFARRTSNNHRMYDCFFFFLSRREQSKLGHFKRHNIRTSRARSNASNKCRRTALQL